MINGCDSCRTFSPTGLPNITRSNLAIPEDFAEFYKLTAGARVFYDDSPFGYQIWAPEKVSYANPLLLGELYEQQKAKYDNDHSSALYLFADSSAGYVTISLAQDKSDFGFCFDSSGSYHGTEESIVIAKSFTEFLTLAYEAKGQNILWDDLNPKYGYLGDL